MHPCAQGGTFDIVIMSNKNLGVRKCFLIDAVEAKINETEQSAVIQLVCGHRSADHYRDISITGSETDLQKLNRSRHSSLLE